MHCRAQKAEDRRARENPALEDALSLNPVYFSDHIDCRTWSCHDLLSNGRGRLVVEVVSVLLRNLSKGTVLATDLRIAQSFGHRLRGLMGRHSLDPGEGLMLRPCKAVHTHFMRFPIDLVFVGRSMRVVRVIQHQKPWGQSPLVSEALAVIELAAGAAGPTSPGDRLEISDPEGLRLHCREQK